MTDSRSEHSEKSEKDPVAKTVEDGARAAKDVAKAVKSDAKRDARKVRSKRTRMSNSSEFKRQVYYALENVQQGRTITKVVGGFLFLLIVANAVLVFLSAQPDLEPLTTKVLYAFFVFSAVCFCIEYICRVWIADLAYGNCTRAQARAKYIFSAFGIIDFMSFAPSMISWFLPVNYVIVHVVNLLRLIRLMKVTRYMRGFRTMGRVLAKHKGEITASFLVIIIVILASSLVMYEAEHAAQPDKFTDLFQGIWFAVETVTSTGYGEIVPITAVGKACGMVIMLLSLGLIAIPGGIFSAGFVAEFQNANMRRIERDVQRNRHSHEDEEKRHASSSDASASTSNPIVNSIEAIARVASPGVDSTSSFDAVGPTATDSTTSEAGDSADDDKGK